MSDAQPATPEQEARMEMHNAIQQAQKQAYEDVQRNAQIELQMRGNSLSLAVEAHKDSVEYKNGTAAEIAKTAQVFLDFLKKGEAPNV